MDNSSIKKIQKDLKKSKPLIIKSDDTSTHIKENYGNKYLDDISDSDVDDAMSYKRRNDNIISKLPEKNNIDIKQKIDADTLSIKSMSVKKAPLRSTIRDNIKILDEPENKVEKKLNNNQNNNQNNKQNNNQVIKKDNDNNSETENNELNENSANSANNSNSANSANSENESLEEYEFKDDFENQVKNYVRTDDKIKELQKEIKELTQKKKISEDSIMKHLERLGETNINITGGKLIVNKYGSKGSFKEDIVKEVLTQQIKDKKILDNIFDKIQEIREENSKIQMGLKRTSAKKK